MRLEGEGKYSEPGRRQAPEESGIYSDKECGSSESLIRGLMGPSQLITVVQRLMANQTNSHWKWEFGRWDPCPQREKLPHKLLFSISLSLGHQKVVEKLQLHLLNIS